MLYSLKRPRIFQNFSHRFFNYFFYNVLQILSRFFGQFFFQFFSPINFFSHWFLANFPTNLLTKWLDREFAQLTMIKLISYLWVEGRRVVGGWVVAASMHTVTVLSSVQFCPPLGNHYHCVKCLFAHSECANLDLNAHTLCAHLDLNAHTLCANFHLNAHCTYTMCKFQLKFS